MELLVNKKYSVKEIIELFKNEGFEISIYNGLRNHCRCGCGGNYYDNNERVINNVINRFGNLKLKYTSDFQKNGYHNSFVKHWDNDKHIQYYVEIGTQDKDYYFWEEDKEDTRRCYAIYFEKDLIS